MNTDELRAEVERCHRIMRACWICVACGAQHHLALPSHCVVCDESMAAEDDTDDPTPVE